MKIKIYKNAKMKNPRHDQGKPYLKHDDIVIRVIHRMRSTGLYLVHYDEAIDDVPTVMEFEGRYENDKTN